MTQATEPRPPAPAPHIGLGFRLARIPALADEATRHLLPWAKARALADRPNGSNARNAKKGCNPHAGE